MEKLEDTTYHIYARDKVLYCNLPQEDFEETWEMLKVMVDLLDSKYSAEDLSYIKLGSKCGVGGPGRVIQKELWEEDSY